jgi:hypothetical protein
MPTIVFSAGATLSCSASDAHGLMGNIARTAGGQRASERGIPRPSDFVDVDTDDGVRHVNPAQVAYVYDATSLRPAPFRTALRVRALATSGHRRHPRMNAITHHP